MAYWSSWTKSSYFYILSHFVPIHIAFFRLIYLLLFSTALPSSRQHFQALDSTSKLSTALPYSRQHLRTLDSTSILSTALPYSRQHFNTLDSTSVLPYSRHHFHTLDSTSIQWRILKKCYSSSISVVIFLFSKGKFLQELNLPCWSHFLSRFLSTYW